MADEQRVRTMAGWIGVEISKSRARKASNPEFGLYRVRGSKHRDPFDFGRPRMVAGDEMPDIRKFVPTEWTAYAFTLTAIRGAVEAAIEQGRPAGPGMLRVAGRRPDMGDMVAAVPTRWTQAYRGRRDLGVEREAGRRAAAAMHERQAAAGECSHGLYETCPYGLSMGEHDHSLEPFGCDKGGEPHLGPCMTARQRQREQNAEFHREHLKRRAWGLKQRHRRKAEHNERALRAARTDDDADGSAGA